MSYPAHQSRNLQNSEVQAHKRITAAVWVFFATIVAVIARLFFLMVWQHDFYATLASNTHESTSKLVPARGQIYVSDARTGVPHPIALNDDVYTLYADTRDIKDSETANTIAAALEKKFKYSPERKNTVVTQLNKRSDPYEPLEQKINQATFDEIKGWELPGLQFVRQPHRRYPENNLAATVIGFVGKNEQGNDMGRYGIEGYWQKDLAGLGGFFEGLRSASGARINAQSQKLRRFSFAT